MNILFHEDEHYISLSICVKFLLNVCHIYDSDACQRLVKCHIMSFLRQVKREEVC